MLLGCRHSSLQASLENTSNPRPVLLHSWWPISFVAFSNRCCVDSMAIQVYRNSSCVPPIHATHDPYSETLKVINAELYTRRHDRVSVSIKKMKRASWSGQRTGNPPNWYGKEKKLLDMIPIPCNSGYDLANFPPLKSRICQIFTERQNNAEVCRN